MTELRGVRGEVAEDSADLHRRILELELELVALRQSAGPAGGADPRARSVVEKASNPVFCYETDPPFSTDLPTAEQIERLYDCVLAQCNEACAEAYGADSIAAVVGRKLTDLFGTRTGSLDALFEQMVRDGYRTIDGESVEVLPDGSTRHFVNNAYGVVEDGKLLRIWGSFRDTTEQRAAEDALRKERELTEAAWNAQRDTFFLFEPETGKAVRWNRAFRETTGYSDEEIAGLPAPASYYDAQDLERAEAFLRRLSETESGTIELGLICKDGHKVPTEYSAAVVSDREGLPRYLISIGRDVSERRRAEEEVRRHRERLLRFMDSATDSFHLVSSQLRVLDISKTAIDALKTTGSRLESKEDVIGMSLLDVYPFMGGAGGEEKFRRVLRTGEPILFDDAVEHPTRGTVYLTVRAFKVGDDLGIIASDVSEGKRAEQERLHLERQVQHAQKLESLGVLAGGIAHDFNNLLVGVLGNADLAMRHIEISSPAWGLLEGVIEVANRAAELANQMLAYSGKGQFVVEPMDLSGLVKEMSTLIEASVSKKIRTIFELDESLPAAEVDVTQLRQIVLNLAINASEAIGDSVGTISIGTGSRQCDREFLAETYLGDAVEEGSYVYLEVGDTGAGMDAQTLERIFDPFFTTKSTGRGLGLAATLGIVRGHHGAIKLKSGPGHGTTITVLLPASKEPAVGPTAGTADRDHWTGSGKVLLVDDEDVVRTVGAAMLGRLGFDVLLAEDGRQGVEVFRQHADEIELVVLDLAMPNMSGDDVFREIRSIKSDARVLLSSGFSEQEVSDKLGGSGLAGFIQKPYRLGALRRKAREILDS